MKAAPGLPERFRAALEAGAAGAEPGPWVVAVSGGLDSVALLHLLRFAGPADARPLVVAHFDHRMRADSAEDAAWVRGLCRAWAVPLEVGR
ncbi:MAG TPA: ATP-binding protein, partial [Longimicrobiales bacterium]|nr:ATP-binding protein [Longimicrobiales bacterium]